MANPVSKYFPWSFTAPTVTQEEVEAEKRALSDEERRLIQDDIDGSYKPMLETPQLIADKIEKMNEHIDEIDEDDKESYLTAQEKCPEYCNSEDFRLMFLRADKFDAEKAANRLVEYWEEKLELFGPEHTYHRLSIDDMFAFPVDVQLMQSGALYILPEKDAAGRGILFLNRDKTNQPNFVRETSSKLRLIWYMTQCLLEDDEISQKKGFVLIVAPPQSDLTTGFDRKFTKRSHHFSKAVFPCRIAVQHVVVPAISFVNLVFLPVVYHLLGKETRNRYKLHRFSQSPKETGETFEEYGIKVSFLPIELGGDVTFDYDAWLEQRRAIEEAGKIKDGPTPGGILPN